MKNVVLGIIIHNNSILVGQLHQDKVETFNIGTQYTFPGGKVEAGESLEEAVIREVLEETGLKVKPIAKIGERQHPHSGRSITYFHCAIVGGESTTSHPENDDIQELIWVSIHEIKRFMPTLYDDVWHYLEVL